MIITIICVCILLIIIVAGSLLRRDNDFISNYDRITNWCDDSDAE